jgi:hypothetical protein
MIGIARLLLGLVAFVVSTYVFAPETAVLVGGVAFVLIFGPFRTLRLAVGVAMMVRALAP